MPIRRSPGLLLLVAALVAACGSSGGTSQPTRATSTSAPQPTQAGGGATLAPISTPAGGGGGGVGSNGVPTIVDGAYPTGTVHVEITGDQTITVDAVGGGAGVNGAVILNYARAADGYAISFSLLKDEDSGWAMTSANLILGGTWGQDCDIKITRNDGSGLSGEFSCQGVDGIDGTGQKSYRLNVKGNFTNTR